MAEKAKKKGVWDFTKGVMNFTALRNITTTGSSFAITFPPILAKKAGLNEHDTVFVELRIKPIEKMTPEDFKKLKDKKPY